MDIKVKPEYMDTYVKFLKKELEGILIEKERTEILKKTSVLKKEEQSELEFTEFQLNESMKAIKPLFEEISLDINAAIEEVLPKIQEQLRDDIIKDYVTSQIYTTLAYSIPKFKGSPNAQIAQYASQFETRYPKKLAKDMLLKAKKLITSLDYADKIS